MKPKDPKPETDKRALNEPFATVEKNSTPETYAKDSARAWFLTNRVRTKFRYAKTD